MRRMRLAGTMMNKDIPIFEFSFEEGMYCEFRRLEREDRLVPWELRGNVSKEDFVQFFLDRVTPSTRIGINEEMMELGLGPYDPSVLIEYQNASTVDDTYWVRFKGKGPQTWKALVDKIGFTVYW